MRAPEMSPPMLPELLHTIFTHTVTKTEPRSLGYPVLLNSVNKVFPYSSESESVVSGHQLVATVERNDRRRGAHDNEPNRLLAPFRKGIRRTLRDVTLRFGYINDGVLDQAGVVCDFQIDFHNPTRSGSSSVEDRIIISSDSAGYDRYTYAELPHEHKRYVSECFRFPVAALNDGNAAPADLLK